jgi:Ala-tRNA(Pro) deacylase
MRVHQFLRGRGVSFERLRHCPPTYDAQRLAETLHVPGDTVAKTVLLRVNGGYAFAVLPATHLIDMAAIREVLPSSDVRLAREREFAEIFPDFEFGALPPFGSKYGLRTLVDAALTKVDQIVFQGNTHDEAIRMKYADFERLEHPIVTTFSHHL